MSKAMTLERATEFGSAWNTRDPDLVTSFFADDGVYHASVGLDRIGKTYRGKEEIRKGVKAFFERFPDARFENLKVVVAGDTGSFEWDLDATFLLSEATKSLSRTHSARPRVDFRLAASGSNELWRRSWLRSSIRKLQ